MKAFKIFFTFAAVTIGLSFAANAQCADDDVLDDCGNTLNKSFRYLKTYDVDGGGEYSYVFSRGNTYLIQTCSMKGISGKMKITILDRTKHKIAANYNRAGQVLRPYVAYRCNSTSIYYVKFEVDDNAAEECGVGVLGFR